MLITRHAANSIRQPLALTIGNFDGVHLGHQAMLTQVKQAAERLGLTACVMTFEPHPREFLVPGQAPVRLTSLREKLLLLARTGISRVQLVRFNRAFASIPASTFITCVLQQALDVRWLLIGDDFRFGANRQGDRMLLQQYAAQPGGFELEIMPGFTVNELRVSSTVIRDALADGDLRYARAMLGRDYSISGRVVDGNKIGKKIGFPTANIHLKNNHPPLNGIFVVEITDQDSPHPDQRIQGVASLGRHPTIYEAETPVLEVHLFNFKQEIYGHRLCVHFLHKLRDEAKYSDLGTLVRQITQDVIDAKNFLTQRSPILDVYPFHS
ncbi:MAG: bifunctional riboflavin kinase/FAD synthetase [Nitrosomonas sp.]|nr:bifunctional riboflavin kinase/FAD synthetase [Nitrosomonas sp.]